MRWWWWRPRPPAVPVVVKQEPVGDEQLRRQVDGAIRSIAQGPVQVSPWRQTS